MGRIGLQWDFVREEERMLSRDGYGWEWNPMRCVWDRMCFVWYLSMM